MAGIKRSINGQAKPQTQVQQTKDVAMTDATPPCGQPQPPSNKTTSSNNIPENPPNPPKPEPATKKPSATSTSSKQPSASRSTNPKPRQKLARLPKDVTITTRPLLHAPLPSPFSSSSSAKTLYITATTPYIPTVKRVRKLLNEVVKREKQSAASLQKAKGRGGRYAEANGRLEARDVEAEIAGAISRADGNNRNGSNGGIGGGGQLKAKEQVYLKATGRAIPRVLEIGLHFQTEKDCWVKVEMGSVSAIDDIEVKRRTGTAEVGTREAEAEAEEEADDVPETRIRTLSSVTVTISLK